MAKLVACQPVSVRPPHPVSAGKPYSPYSLVDVLASPRSSHLIRSLAYEELVIRYRVDFAFETDFLVDVQQRLLSEFRKWLDAHQEVAERYGGIGSI